MYAPSRHGRRSAAGAAAGRGASSLRTPRPPRDDGGSSEGGMLRGGEWRRAAGPVHACSSVLMCSASRGQATALHDACARGPCPSRHPSAQCTQCFLCRTQHRGTACAAHTRATPAPDTPSTRFIYELLGNCARGAFDPSLPSRVGSARLVAFRCRWSCGSAGRRGARGAVAAGDAPRERRAALARRTTFLRVRRGLDGASLSPSTHLSPSTLGSPIRVFDKRTIVG